MFYTTKLIFIIQLLKTFLKSKYTLFYIEISFKNFIFLNVFELLYSKGRLSITKQIIKKFYINIFL